MAITFKRVKNNPGVELRTLNTGDTFLYDNRVGVIISHNGHNFPTDLNTCAEFKKYSLEDGRRRNPQTLSDFDLVVPVEVEMTYRVTG